MEPITRQEQLLDSIATGDSVELEPITREEMYLSAIAGSTESKPEKPITRKEMFYEKILESGGVGGDGTAKPTQTKTIEVVENGTYKVTPDSGKVLSSVTAKVNVPQRYDEGFLQGFAEGKQQGRTEGYSNGYEAGVDSVKLQEKTVTENGDVLPDSGFSGMSKVTVAVSTGSSKEEQEKTVSITENGTTEVTPDEGKTLSKVTIETLVSGGGSGEVDEGVKAAIEGGATEVVLPNSISKIGAYKFYKETNLVNIQAAGVTSIGDQAFNSCSNLAITELPAGLTSIGNQAFYMCSNLAITELPAGLTSIGDQTFHSCSNLAITELPAGLTSIGNNCFVKCTTINKITFKGKPNEVGTNIFFSCSNLKTINVPWAEGEVANAPWGATNATINYNYTGA